MLFCISNFRKFSERKVSQDLQLVYFVTADFSEKSSADATQLLDKEVETTYMSNLRQACTKETMQSKQSAHQHYVALFPDN